MTGISEVETETGREPRSRRHEFRSLAARAGACPGLPFRSKHPDPATCEASYSMPGSQRAATDDAGAGVRPAMLFAGCVERLQGWSEMRREFACFPTHGLFQRFRDFRPAECTRRRLGDDIPPHRRQRLAGLERSLDRHSPRSAHPMISSMVRGPQFRAVARSLKRSFRSRSLGGIHLPLGGSSPSSWPPIPSRRSRRARSAIASRGKFCRNMMRDHGSVCEPRSEARTRRRTVAGSRGVRRDAGAIADRNGSGLLSPCVLSLALALFRRCSFGGIARS